MSAQTPDYAGAGLVSLVSELELRLAGSAPLEGLADPGALPEGPGYVLVVFDGLGARQLGAAPAALAESLATVLTAGFPTTTTTSLATLATGTAPVTHGIIGHLLRLPGVADTVNVLKWVLPDGRPVRADFASMLPAPNLWERLTAAGIEPVTVQPGAFVGSPLSQMLYRGCRFEPVWTVDEIVDATIQLARPGRLVMTYYPSVDVAAHVHGQASAEYRRALDEAARIWERISAGVPGDLTVVATADHGLVDYEPAGKLLLRDPRLAPLHFFGDPRATYVSGPQGLIEGLAAETAARLVPRSEVVQWLGPGRPHPDLAVRLPDAALLAAPGTVLLPPGFDKRLVGYHGGLQPEEVEIPLLVR